MAKTKYRTKSEPQTPADPELQAVVEAWPELPEVVRVGIVAMVKAAKP